MIQECSQCGLLFKSHTLTAGVLSDYYSDLNFAPFEGEYDFPTDAALLAQLKQVRANGRILDYGCSTGRILHALGPGYQRFGIEVNDAAAKMAVERGINIISEADLAQDRMGRFDAIVLADVFEHLIEPTATVHLLASRLAHQGKLLIVTGFADAVLPRSLIGEHWYFSICGHLQMLSGRHLNWLAQTAGLEVASLEKMSHYRRERARLAKQIGRAVLFTLARAAAGSNLGGVMHRLPILKRGFSWTHMPSTDQFSDHVLAVLTKH